MSNYTSFKYDSDPNTPWYKIVSMIPDKSRVLDVGCSSGNLGEILKKEKNCEVIGVDIDANDVNLAKQKLNEAYVKNVATDDLEELGKFDYVVFADVIEHLMDPVSVLKKIKRLLNQGGAVIYSIPNMAHMSTRLMLLKGDFKYGEIGLLDKTHVHFYDYAEVKRVFNDAGYTLKVFDWVERYLPEDLVKQQLTKIGLKPNQEFLKMNKQVEALAYEYVGKAVVGDKIAKSPKLDFISPYTVETEERVDAIRKSYDDQLRNYEKEKSKEMQRLKAINEELTSQYNEILTSMSWRSTKWLKLVHSIFKKKGNNVEK